MKKKYLSYLIIFILVNSCKSKEEKLKEEMKPILSNIMLQDSIVSKLDSLTIYKIDTLTDLIYNRRKLNSLFAKQELFLKMADIHKESAQLLTSSAKSSQNIARLYKSSLNDAFLAKLELEQSDEYIRESEKEIAKMGMYTDSAQIMQNVIAGLTQNIKTGKIDSIKFRGFIPRFRVIGANKGGVEVKLDSLYIYLSESLNIIPVK